MNKKEVSNYTKFRKNFPLDYKILTEKDGCIYYDGEIVEDENKKYAEGERFLNIGYNLKKQFVKGTIKSLSSFLYLSR